MRRAVLSFLIIFGSLLAAWQVAGQGMLTLGAGSSKTGGTVGTLSADGTASNENNGSTTSTTLTLSTTKTNDVIAVCPGANGQAIVNVSGSPSLGSFTKRAGTGVSSPLELWYNISAGTLMNEVITVSIGSAAFVFATALAVNGADISSPPTSFVDPNGSLPATNTTGTPTGLSTTKNATLIIGCMRGNGDGAPPATWTDAAGGNRGSAFMAMDYKIFASPQTSIGIADTMTGINGWVADAIKASGQ